MVDSRSRERDLNDRAHDVDIYATRTVPRWPSWRRCDYSHGAYALDNQSSSPNRSRPAQQLGIEEGGADVSGEVEISVRTDHSWINSAAAGALSGIACAVFVSPLDVVKARKQVQGSLQGASRHKYKGTWDSLRVIFRHEGIGGFFRGLPPTLLGYVPSWSIYFSSYGYLKETLSEEFGPTVSPLGLTIVSAIVAGTLTNLCTNPFWLLRTRLQMQETSHGEYNGTLDAARKIWKQEGPLAFYKGLTASLLGLSHVAVQFPVYEGLKTYFAATKFVQKREDQDMYNQQGGALTNWKNLSVLVVSSTVSKIVATILTYPHDVARVRLHVNRDAVRHAKNSTGIVDQIAVLRVLRDIYHVEGYRGWYAGMGTQLIRVSPACAVTFTSYELLLSYFNSYSEAVGAR